MDHFQFIADVRPMIWIIQSRRHVIQPIKAEGVTE